MPFWYLGKKYLDFIKVLQPSLYVDDLLTGCQALLNAHEHKEKSIEVPYDATFQLDKWHWNIKKLEIGNDQAESHGEQSFAKQQFRVQPSETRRLGLNWNKEEDTLTTNFLEDDYPLTRRI